MRAHALWMSLLFVACRDSQAGPPPKRLGPEQQRELEAHLLKELPSPEYPAQAMLGGGRVRYLGSSVAPSPALAGRPLRVTHYFQCLQPLDRDYKLFVHVEEASTPGMLVNADHVPVGGLYPTSRWKSGEIIEDVQELAVPFGARRLAFYLGLYWMDTRLPVDDAASQDGQNRLRGPVIDVVGLELSLPLYKARHTARPPRIDGDLSDPEWKLAEPTAPFTRSLDGGQPKYRTRARMLWDESHLYVAFECEDEDVWGKLRENDSPIYGEEVVEVFIDADGDGRTYNELEVSPHNVHFDAYFPAHRQGMDLAWDSGMVSAVKVDGTLDDASDRDRGWTVEMAIPVDRLAAVPHSPRAGDRWRVNLYRLEWHSGRGVNEGSAFSPPLVGDFHHLARFGWLELVP